MAYDVAAITKALDYFWEAMPQETAEMEGRFYERLERAETKDSNIKGLKQLVRTRYNQSESWAGFDGAAYATPDNSDFEEIFIRYKMVSKTGVLTKEALDNADQKAHYDPLAGEIKSAIATGMKLLNRHFISGDGIGTLAVLTANYSGGATTSLTAAASATWTKGVQYLGVGKYVNVVSTTGATTRTGSVVDTTDYLIKIATITKSTGVVTFTSQVPTDAVIGDRIVPERSVLKTPHGVIGYQVLATGDYYGLTRSSYPGLQSKVVDAASAALDLTMVESLFAELQFQVNVDAAVGTDNGEAHELWWSPTQRQAYRNSMLAAGITLADGKEINGGYLFKERINGMTANCDPDWSNNEIHALKMSTFKKIVRGNAEKPFDVIPINGQKLVNQVDSRGRWTSNLQFTMGGYTNLFCNEPRANGKITALATTGLATGNS